MLGGTLEAYYWCYGDTDFMCIMDVPDSAKIAKLSLHIGASGTFQGKLTPLISVEEMDEICKADIGNFRLPGHQILVGSITDHPDISNQSQSE